MQQMNRLLKEFQFAAHHAGDLTSGLALITNTALFHGGNKFSIRSHGPTFRTRLALANQPAKPITMRRHSGDIFIFYEVFMDETYSIPSEMVPEDNVRVIVDCGANIGFSALYFCGKYPNATVYAVEASEANFRLLEKNVRSQGRIIPIHAAVTGQETETVSFSTGQKAWGNRVVSAAGEGVEHVRAVTLDQLSQECGFEHIDLLKVDIEGGEVDLFSDASFLKRTSFGVIELHPPYSPADFSEDLSRYGFGLVTPDPDAGLNIMVFRPSAGSTEATT